MLQQHHLPLTSLLLNPIRNTFSTQTHQLVDHLKFTTFSPFEKLTVGFPLFSFQTLTQFVILTRTAIEMYESNLDGLIPQQSVELSGEILMYSFSSQIWPPMNDIFHLYNDEFCVLKIEHGEEKIVKFHCGEIVFEKHFSQRISSVGICPNDVLVGGRNFIRKVRENVISRIHGTVNCVKYPFFTTVQGDVFVIDESDTLAPRHLAKMSKQILQFVAMEKWLVIQYVNKSISLVPIKRTNENSSQNSLQSSFQSSSQNSFQNSFEDSLQLGDDIELHSPIPVESFYCRENYLLVMNSTGFVVCLIDEKGLVDILCEEHGDFENVIPSLLVNELEELKIVLIDSKEMRLSL